VYQDAAQEQLKRTRIHYLTDTQVFNQDTNLEVKFSTGALAHRVLGGIDYTNYQASQGTASATSDTLFNPYSAVNPKGQWKGVGCDGTVYDGVTKSYDVPEVCRKTDSSLEQTGLYVQDQMRLGDWIAVAGMRKDWIEQSAPPVAPQKDDAITYRAGLMYEFASGFTPYLSYGESFIPVVARTWSGAPLDPQQGRMYELGFKYAPNGANFAINGAIFDIAENNRLSSDPDHVGFSVQTGAVTSKGGEIEFTGKVTENLKIVTGYSYTEAVYDDPSPTAAAMAVYGNQIESIPKHLASFWGVWEFDQPWLKGWSAGAGVRYIGESWDSKDIYEIPSVTLIDAMVAYEEEHWRWQLNGSNLEDKVYLSTCLNRGDCWFGSARTITTSLTYKY
jgi:iron complex outermembrane receptor protein